MGWYFRKSVNLGGGARANFSKSGVGFSFGGRGYRVSTGPRGTYVNVGAGGVYYRQKIGGPYGRTYTPRPPLQPTGVPVQTETIPTAHASELVDESSADIVASINARTKQTAYAGMGLLAALLISLSLYRLGPWVIMLAAMLTAYPVYLLHQADTRTRTSPLFFELDEVADKRWSEMNEALAKLGQATRIWRVEAIGSTYDWKRNAGATSLLTRWPIQLFLRSPEFIATNVKPYCLDTGRQKLYFMPDRVYVYEGGRYGAVSYSDLLIETGATNFIESGSLPADSVVVRETWRFVNKDGSPDRRFANNYKIPIVNYGVVAAQSSTGLNLLLHVSSVNAVSFLAGAFGGAASYSRKTTNGRPRPEDRRGDDGRTREREKREQERSSKQEQRNKKQRTEFAPPEESSIPECYRILGLKATCTKEEATSTYHQVVKAYHPDVVAHMAAEFREIAEERMKEINAAWTELKKLRGWH